MKKIIKLFFITVVCVVMFSSCGNSNKPDTKSKEHKNTGAKVSVPAFNADSAFYFVKKHVLALHSQLFSPCFTQNNRPQHFLPFQTLLLLQGRLYNLMPGTEKK